MRKLELKDIVGYLPYRLQGLCRGEVVPFIISTHYNCDLVVEHCLNTMSDIKPLLRPMSDLTIPIVVKGYNNDKAFVPLEVLSYTLFGAVGLIIDQKMCFGYRNKDTFYWDENDFTINYHDSDDYINVSFLKVYDLLDQWHFDYRNLISEGLAIDINTLN